MILRPEEIRPRVEITVPDNIGHGNPWTARAIEWELSQHNFDTHFNALTRTSLPAMLFHQFMTRYGVKILKYNENSENIRNGILGEMYSALASVELLLNIDRYARVHIFVQEHPLLFLSKELLDEFAGVRYLFIPDSYPKNTAIEASLTTGTPLVVWNEGAEKELQRIGVKTILVRPFFSHLFEQTKETTTEEVVVKTSGSGIPNEWLRMIQTTCMELHIPFRFFTPGMMVWHTGISGAPIEKKVLKAGIEEMIACYTYLASYPPRVLVIYPSEMIQIAALLKEKKCKTVCYLLPPRGGHEMGNATYANNHNIWDGPLPLDAENLRAVLLKKTPGNGLRDLDFGRISTHEMITRELESQIHFYLMHLRGEDTYSE